MDTSIFRVQLSAELTTVKTDIAGLIDQLRSAKAREFVDRSTSGVLEDAGRLLRRSEDEREVQRRAMWLRLAAVWVQAAHQQADALRAAVADYGPEALTFT
jgi:hypothetical protein